jgi:ribokinase
MNLQTLFSSPEVAVLGAAALDWVARVKEFPRRDSIVFADEYKPMPGGTGGNVAEGVARLGHKVCFMGKLGDDEGGKILLMAFEDSGVDTRGVIVAPGQRSASCFIPIDEHGERQIYCIGGVALYEDEGELKPELMNEVAVLFIADAFQNVALKAMGMIPPGAKVVFNPGGLMASYGEKFLKPIFERTDALLVSQEEAKTITHLAEPRAAATALASMGVKVVMHTLGADGVLLLESGKFITLPSFPVKHVVDTTGAGDAFAAGVIAGVVQGMDWVNAARMGCASASIKIANMGARSGLPDRKQVLDLLGKKRGG